MSVLSFFNKIGATLQQWEAEAIKKKSFEETQLQSRLSDAADLFINGYGVDFHCSDRQFERFQRARATDTVGPIISINKKKMCCVIRSSSHADMVYKTTLSCCTCEDFVRSGNPCKHIYKLALELGIINTDWDISGIPIELRQRIDSLSFDERIKFIKLIPYHTSYNKFEVKKATVPASLISQGLVFECTDYVRILNENFSKNDIIAALAVSKSSYFPTSKSTKTEMIGWIIANDIKLLHKLCNKHYYISFTPEVFSSIEYIYRDYKYLLN